MTRVAPSHFMGIDAATRRNLELTQTLAGQRGGSLLAGIDRTVTACGARMLAGAAGGAADRCEGDRRAA